MIVRKIFKNEIFYLAFASLFLFLLFSYYAIISPGCGGGMDSYNHFLISKYSWKYPFLFLDQWGKPLYNIIASPFANLGFLGVEIFNIILWLASAWLVWATIKKLGMNYAWLGFLLVVLPQVSIENVISGLTEYLNEFLLALFIFLAASKRWNLAAFVCGLLPFARSEGFVIMAATGFYLLFIEKQYKSLLWFMAGPIIFNIIGWFVTGNLFWIISNNPYIKAESLKLNLCGSGSFFHYFKEIHYIFSFAGAILLLLGSFLALIFYIKCIHKKVFLHRFILWLVAGILWLYFGVHSFIWWQGMMGSCGYTRVMIVITPLMAILGTYSLNILAQNFEKYKNYFLCFVILLLFISLSHTRSFIKNHFPISLSAEQKEFVKVADWLDETNYQGGMTYHLYAYLSVIANIDPYDQKHFTDLWSFDFKYSPVGSIIIWDGHFGPNECRIPLEKLKNNPDFILLKSFIPEKAFTTLNNYPFEIHVFKRIKNSQEIPK
ncbi:MAG: hypothetical protein ACKVQB_00940 [Bacteroidia bacterium]